MTMNLNEDVCVMLTELGKTVLLQSVAASSHKANWGVDGIYITQLWVLMKVFGPHLAQSIGTPMFKNGTMHSPSRAEYTLFDARTTFSS